MVSKEKPDAPFWRRKIRVGQDETVKRAASGLKRLADRRET
jgi:hypothetical protein